MKLFGRTRNNAGRAGEYKLRIVELLQLAIASNGIGLRFQRSRNTGLLSVVRMSRPSSLRKSLRKLLRFRKLRIDLVDAERIAMGGRSTKGCKQQSFRPPNRSLAISAQFSTPPPFLLPPRIPWSGPTYLRTRGLS